MLCPCRSKLAYKDCCQVFHETKPAKTPEQLMRSRYSAYALGIVDYLASTLHSSKHTPNLIEELVEFSSSVKFKNLTVLSASEVTNNIAYVHFKAWYQTFDTHFHWMQENSRFIFEGGKWFYVEGNVSLNEHPIKLNRE